jgi:glycosyltransferase involved in cell wall biosynthesis
MVNGPRFSVVIPVHNGTPFLGATLKSVLDQDPGPERMEIVVVDDCSKDDPKSLVESCGGGRVKFVRSDEPLGPCRAFNRCVREATGELVHMLHADDKVLPGFYERVDRVFSADPALGMFVCRAYEIDTRGRRQSVLSIPPLVNSRRIEHFYHLLVPLNWVRTPGVVVPRAAYERLGTYDERLNHTQDWNMWLRLGTRYPVWYEDEVLTEYRVHSASDTTFKLKNGKYLAEFDLAVRYWLDENPDIASDQYLHKIEGHVRKLAMEDVWRQQLAKERVELIRGIFNEHLPELAPVLEKDISIAYRDRRRNRVWDAVKGAIQ